MNVYQYYYTSYIHKRTGQAGFQVKAMSPDLSPTLQALLMRHIAYRIPSSLATDTLEAHPISLRYFFTPSGQGILLCSQSSGKDEYERPGNFFVHAVILDRQHFTSMPAIFFWKSPFWQKQDAKERDEIASLPVLDTFDEEPTMDSEQIWRFLAQEDRRTQLYKLLCALVHSHATQQRIVIVDSDEHVALWIAAVSCLLPPEYRPLLTFATYHHDVQQAQYLITGMYKDSPALLRLELSPSYFVLDAETGKTSHVEASPYAELAANAAQPDRYETHMLPIFADFTRRFPSPQCIDEQLDALVLYASIQSAASGEEILTPAASNAIHSALPSFVALPVYSQQDSDELCQIARVLRKTVETVPQDTLYADYQCVLALLQTHLPDFFDHLLFEALQQLIEQPLRQLQDSIARYLSWLHLFYDEQAMIDMLNSQRYLVWFTQRIQAADCTIQALTQFWSSLGSFIRPDRPCIPSLLQTCFTHITTQSEQEHEKEAHALLQAIEQAMNQQKQGWLQLMVAHYDDLPHTLFEVLYLHFVTSLPLEERLSYRTLVLSHYHRALCDELRADMQAQASTQRLTVLERWIEHAHSQHYATDILIQTGIDQLHQACVTEQEWQALAGRILLNEHLVPLPQASSDALVPLALSSLSMAHFTPTDYTICERYGQLTSPPLKEQVTNIIALTAGCITDEQAKQVEQAISLFPEEEYTSLLERCLPLFLLHMVSDEAHSNLLQALLPHAIQLSITRSFWQAYLQALGALCQQSASKDKGFEILDFWFRTSPGGFTTRYTVQQFFLFLSTSSIIHNTDIATRPWYPALQIMQEKRSSRFSLSGHGLLGRENTHSLDKEIQGLFAHTAESDQYHKIIHLYEVSTPAQFWLCYWKHFSRLLVEKDIDRLYILFSFWFDRAYEVLGTVAYLPQEFFLGLPSTLKSALKAKDLRQLMQRLHEKVQQEEELILSQHWFSVLIALHIW